MDTVKKNPEKLLDIAMDIHTLGDVNKDVSPKGSDRQQKDDRVQEDAEAVGKEGGEAKLTLHLPNRGNIVHHAARNGANEFLGKIFTTLDLNNDKSEGANELKVFMACVMQDGNGKSALAHAIESKSQGFVKTIFDSYSMILAPAGEGTDRHYHDLGPGKQKEVHPSDLINVQDLCLALKSYPLMVRACKSLSAEPRKHVSWITSEKRCYIYSTVFYQI